MGCGSVSGRTFTKRYRTDHLFTPPRIFGVTHFPDEARWQLRDEPLTRGEFFRQPVLQPRFYADGLSLVAPDRSQVTAAGSLAITLENPRGLFLLAHHRPKGGGDPTDCGVTGGGRAEVSCSFPADGRFEVLIFASPVQYNSPYHHVATFSVNNDD